MNKLQYLDFVKFHTPIDEKEQKQIFLVVDESADDEEHKSLKVMLLGQTLAIKCINTFIKADFELYYRPTEEEKKQITNGNNLSNTSKLLSL